MFQAVLQLKRCSMGAGDGGNKRKTETRSRRRPALFKTYETFKDTVAILRRHTGSIVSDGKDGAAIPGGPHFKLDARAAFCIFQRIVEEIRDRLTDKLA